MPRASAPLVSPQEELRLALALGETQLQAEWPLRGLGMRLSTLRRG